MSNKVLVDLQDGGAAREAFEPLTDITHIAYTAVHEKPELVAGWSSKDQIETTTPCCATSLNRS
jgi:hypothetical protein